MKRLFSSLLFFACLSPALLADPTRVLPPGSKPADARLGKPFTQRRLMAALEQLLVNRRRPTRP